MMADIQESQDISNEIADAIARPMGFQVSLLVKRYKRRGLFKKEDYYSLH